MQRNLNHVVKVQLNFFVPQGIEESVEGLFQSGFEVSDNFNDLVNGRLVHQTARPVNEQTNVFVKLDIRTNSDFVHLIIRNHTTALRRAASRNHMALNFGVRFCVLKST